MEEIHQPTEVKKNWCCILSTSVLSGGLCFFGVSLALRGDDRTGLVLLLSSGGLLALSVCAALGKCREPEEEDKQQSLPPEDPDDRPPSYRLSWRQSFKRRLRLRSEDIERGTNGAGGGGGRGGDAGGGPGDAGGGETRGGRRGWLGRARRERTRDNLQPPISSFPNPDSSSSLGSLLAAAGATGAAGGSEAEGMGSEGTVWGTRHTQSLSNLLDPPPYQEAIANLDEAAIRKLRSEMCLPSAIF